MNSLLNFISIVAPIIFAAFLFKLKNITMEMKIGLWIICALIIIFDLYLIIKDKKAKEEKSKREKPYNRLYERQELFNRNLPRTLIDTLERNPLLADSFQTGQKYEKEYKFEEAIKAYEKCLHDLSIPEEDKISFNILIGNCYFFLSKLEEAEKHFKESLNILKRAENKMAKLPVKSTALGNIGNIFHNLGKSHEALEYYQQALETNRKLGYVQGVAHNLNNIGTVYNELGEQDEALRCQEEALEINQKIEDEPGTADSLNNIGVVYTDSGKPEEALKLFQEVLEINKKMGYEEGIANVFNNIGLTYSKLREINQALNYYQKALKINRKIGYKEGIATNLGNIGLVYITLGQSEEALKYYQEALEVFVHINAQPRIEILLKIIKILVENKKISYKPIRRIGLLLLAVCFIVVGFFQLVKYVPSVKEALILATTVKPETFTELYFEDHLSLPNKVTLFKENNFRFTIHNLENKDMVYIYEVYIDVNREKQMIDKNSVLIKNNEYKTITEDFTITVPMQRVKAVINLIGKNQQIHFWMAEE
jgi:tetratricopeptide (TPR) repeat protein